MIQTPPVEAQRQIERRVDRIEAFREIGAVLLGNVMDAPRQTPPRRLRKTIEIANHCLGFQPQFQRPVPAAIGRHQNGRDCQCMGNIGRRCGSAAQKRDPGLNL